MNLVSRSLRSAASSARLSGIVSSHKRAISVLGGRIVQQNASHVAAITTLRRPFFASSTDHTRLLQEAEVHCLDRGGGIHDYVLAAGGTDAELVKKVPHLHLARLTLNVPESTMYDAKVINRTLGTRDVVCGKLVDACLKDTGAGTAYARSNLHGLSEWALRGLRNEVLILCETKFTPDEVAAVTTIAEGRASDEVYTKGQKAWEQLIQEFLQQKVGDEATLYQTKGGKFVKVLHKADTSDYADTSGGAMVLFSF